MMLTRTAGKDLHIRTISHEGKVLLFATDVDRKVIYTVRRDGFEDRSTTDAPELEDWENWRDLEFPDEENDASVIASENLSVEVNSSRTLPELITKIPLESGLRLLTRSVYRSKTITAAAPVSLVSGLGYLHVFRTSTSGTVLADRFVLDGLTNTLVRKLDVRFKRSRMKHTPLEGRNGGADIIDAMDFRDANNQPFHEPTTELRFLNEVAAGQLSVVLLPGNESDLHWWHFFTVNSRTKNLEIASVRASADGRFDLSDVDGEPGLTKRTILLKSNNQALTINGVPIAARYDELRSIRTKANDDQLIREAVKVMLAVPVTSGVATVSFGAAADGRLATIEPSGQSSDVLRSSSVEVALPPDSLEAIETVTAERVAAKGAIKEIERAADGTIRLTLVADAGGAVPKEGTIRLEAAGRFDGLYRARKVALPAIGQPLPAGGTTLNLAAAITEPLAVGAKIRVNVRPQPVVGGSPFTVELTRPAAAGAQNLTIKAAPVIGLPGTPLTLLDALEIDVPPPIGASVPAGSELGRWEEVLPEPKPEETVPGAIASVMQTSEGRLRLRAPGQSVQEGETVAIEGAALADGLYAITEGGQISSAAVAPARLIRPDSVARKGLELDGNVDHVLIPGGMDLNLGGGFTIEAWIRTTKDGVIFAKAPVTGDWTAESKALAVRDGRLAFIVGSTVIKAGTPVNDGAFHHVAVTATAGVHDISLLVDGQADGTSSLSTIQADGLPVKLGDSANGIAGNRRFEGTLADVRVWETARSGREITNAAGAVLTGSEPGLAGYWRLGAIIEGNPRLVTDFSVREHHGEVHGDPFVGGTLLARTPEPGKQAIRYENDTMVDVTPGATYEERFEFQLDVAGGSNATAPFAFRLFGKRDRDDAATKAFDPITVTFRKIDETTGLTEAVCRFRVQEGMPLVRAFGIGGLRGEWTTMRVRKHRLVDVSDATSASTFEDRVDLPAVQAAKLAEWGAAEKRVAELEESEARLVSQQGLLPDLLQRIEELGRTLGNPLNYWFRLKMGNAAIKVGTRDAGTERGLVIETESPVGVDRAEILFRAEKVRQEGEITIAATDRTAFAASNSGVNYAIISQVPASRRATQQAASPDPASNPVIRDDSELPATALRFTQNGLLSSVLLDPVAFVKKLSPESKENFDGQRNLAPVSQNFPSMARGIPISQLWHPRFPDTESHTNGLITATGGIDLNRPFVMRGKIECVDRPNSEEGFLRTTTSDGGTLAFALGTENQSGNFAFEIPKVDLSVGNQPGQVVDQDRLSSLLAAKEELESALKILRDANLGGNPQQLALDVSQRLTEVRAKLAQARATYAGLQAEAQPVIPMGTLAPSAEVKSLGALLAFVTPDQGSRLDLVENAEGGMTLTFVDSETLTLDLLAGSATETRVLLRQIRFDSGVASRKWQVDALRSCLDLGGGSIGVSGIDLQGDWTAECLVWLPQPGSGDHELLRFEGNLAAVFLRDIPATATTSRKVVMGIRAREKDKPGEEKLAKNALFEIGWRHIAVVSQGTGAQAGTTVYVDGRRVDTLGLKLNGKLADIGASCGRMAEIRLWDHALGAEEIEANSITAATGREPGLIAYLPLNGSAANAVSPAPQGVGIALNGVTATLPLAMALGRLRDVQRQASFGVVTAEYPTLGISARTGQTTATLRRFFAFPTAEGVNLVSQKRLEELELLWIGNAQFAPTLLGYIEGAPPVPSENLTANPDGYAGATSVALEQSREVTYSWNRSKEMSLGGKADFFIGAEFEGHTGAAAGFFQSLRSAKGKLGLKGALAMALQENAQTTVTATSTLVTTDELTLRGVVETTPRFPHLGKRFVPKNVGYALVISALADVYIVRTKTAHRMVSYSIVPTPDVPPDINTITFLINPAYTTNGSLDGLVGTRSANDRFYAHVPRMRARRGSLYPASYLRLREAYDLKRQISELDKQREAYFFNFDANLGATLTESADDAIFKGAGEKPPDVTISRPEDSAKPTETQAQLNAIGGKIDDIEAHAKAQQSDMEAAVEKKRKEVEAQISDPLKREHALQSFASWQAKMENLRIRAGKRNIVNTYVWDADGGLRSEAEQFASTVEHTIGSQISLDVEGGVQAELGIVAFKAELTALVTFSMTQTLSKTITQTNTLALNVALDGVESVGITDQDDRPLMPGEKVDRYRFMTFYLDGSERNFDDFFNYVVDPEWLASNDEEARALRQTQKGKRNPAWRVLHRVTYVERPALMGFGTPARLPAAAELGVEDRVAALQEENKAIRAKLDEILALLKVKAVGAGGGP